MTDEQMRKLETMLRTLPIPAPSQELREQIALAALGVTAVRLSWYAGLQNLFKEFHLPRPVLAIGGLLLIGLTIGFSVPIHGDNSEPDGRVDEIQRLLPDEGM